MKLTIIYVTWVFGWIGGSSDRGFRRQRFRKKNVENSSRYGARICLISTNICVNIVGSCVFWFDLFCDYFLASVLNKNVV